MKLHQKLFWLLIFLLPIQLGRHFWPNFSLVLGLRVDYLSPTIYLTDILILLILILWFISKLKNKNEKLKITIKKDKNLILSFVFFLFLLVNCLLAKNSGVALYKMIKIIEFTLLGLYVAKNINFSFIRYFIISLSLGVIYSSLIALLQFFKQSSLGGFFWWLGERNFSLNTPGIAKSVINGQLIMRPYGTFPHPNVLAGFILVSMILIGLNHSQLDIKNKILYWMTMILGGMTLVFSFSRSALLVGLLICFGLIIQWLRRGKMNKKCLLFISCLLFSLFCFFAYLSLNFSTDEAFSQRWRLVKASFLMIKSNFLSGVGLNNFIIRLPAYWPLTGFTYWLQPVHNIYLLVATETGLMGLIIFLWFLLLTYKKLLLRYAFFLREKEIDKTAKYQLSLIIAFSSVLVIGFFDHYWLTLQQTQLLLTIILGLVWSSKN